MRSDEAWKTSSTRKMFFQTNQGITHSCAWVMSSLTSFLQPEANNTNRAEKFKSMLSSVALQSLSHHVERTLPLRGSVSLTVCPADVNESERGTVSTQIWAAPLHFWLLSSADAFDLRITLLETSRHLETFASIAVIQRAKEQRLPSKTLAWDLESKAAGLSVLLRRLAFVAGSLSTKETLGSQRLEAARITWLTIVLVSVFVPHWPKLLVCISTLRRTKSSCLQLDSYDTCQMEKKYLNDALKVQQHFFFSVCWQ